MPKPGPLPHSIATRAFSSREAREAGATKARLRSSGVIGHRSLNTPTVSIQGLPATEPGRVLLEMASMLSLDELIVVGDALVRRKRPPTTLERLGAVARESRGRNIGRVRAVLGEVRPGTDSSMETRLRLLIVRAGLPEPLIGYTIHDANGDFVGTPDLAYVEQRIAIEYEGVGHCDDPRIFTEDILRRELMHDAGWWVTRVIKDHVFRSPQWLVARIARILAQRTTS